MPTPAQVGYLPRETGWTDDSIRQGNPNLMGEADDLTQFGVASQLHATANKAAQQLDSIMDVRFHRFWEYDKRASEGWEEWIDDINAPRGARVVQHPPQTVMANDKGKPVFRDIPYVRIQAPGAKDYVDRPVTEADKRRWPAKWEAFLKGTDQDSAGGTSIDMFEKLRILNPARVMELKGMNIKTVEQLAECPDIAGQYIMGFHELKRRAQGFLNSAHGEAAKLELQQEREARQTENEEIRKQLAEMRALVEQQGAKIREQNAFIASLEEQTSPTKAA